VLVIQELGEKSQNFDGLGLKIAVLYYLALSPTSLNIFKRYRRRRFSRLSIFLSQIEWVGGRGTKSYGARKHGPLLIIQYSLSLILGVICSARLAFSTLLPALL
jgi:hypothetical protein